MRFSKSLRHVQEKKSFSAKNELNDVYSEIFKHYEDIPLFKLFPMNIISAMFVPKLIKYS